MSDYIAGTFSGFAQTFVGYPFDTLKVLLQSNKKINYKKTFNRSIYKGVQYPFCVNGLSQCIIFGTNQNIYNNVCKNYYISGCLAGMIGSFIISPMELYKIRHQNNLPRKGISPFLGYRSTQLRESIAFSIYFGSYYQMQERINNTLISGGLAGVLCWGASYNIDVIKTRIQSGQCKTIMQGYKMGNLWRGITPCLFRSFIVNAVGFYTYEHILHKCEHREPC